MIFDDIETFILFLFFSFIHLLLQYNPYIKVANGLTIHKVQQGVKKFFVVTPHTNEQLVLSEDFFFLILFLEVKVDWEDFAASLTYFDHAGRKFQR